MEFSNAADGSLQPVTNNIGRIAFFLPSLQGGGAERVMVNLAHALCTCGLKIDFVVAQAQGPYLKELPPAVQLVDLCASRVLAALPGLIRYLRRSRPQVIISAMNHANIVLLLAIRLAACRTSAIVSEHSVASIDLAFHPGLKSWTIKHLMKILYPRARYIVAVSQDVAADLAQLLGFERERIKVIYNPVISLEQLEQSCRPVTHPWFSDQSVPIIMSAGRLEISKDFATLIRAFDRVRRQRPMRLMILGEGKQRLELEALIEQLKAGECVALPGFVDDPMAYMRHADLFVLTSLYEGLPTVLVEAMACNVPVISTDSPGGACEILEHGKWGKLVPVGDPETLSHAILDALEKPPPSAQARL